MRLELDLDWLKEVGLTPDDYVFLMCKHKGVKCPFPLNLPVAKGMEAMGYIKIVKNDDGAYNMILRQQFIDMVEGDFDQMFNELIATYPMKVGSNPQNLRILRAVDPKGKSNKKARDRYKKIVDKKPHVHRKIMKCLDTQLKHQRQNLQYMQLLEVWINSATWEKWEDFKEEPDENRNTKILN